MEKFTPEYIQNFQQIILNDDKEKAKELLKNCTRQTLPSYTRFLISMKPNTSTCCWTEKRPQTC